jgi:Fe-S oxidoreductase
MLTSIEKLLFALLVAICLTAAYNTFGQMARIIGRGQGRLNTNALTRRIVAGIVALINQGGIIRHRRVSSLFHYGVAWGFIFYLFVDLLDILEGLITGFHFFEGNVVGDLFRLAADLFSVAALIGVIYFLVRRFIAQSNVLTVRDNVQLIPGVRSAVRQDSLVVGLFILFHVGFRFLGASFLVLQRGGDPWQPFANLVANGPLLGLAGNPEAINFGWHASWWIALGLIFTFIPYFPYTKHAHLFMGPFNYMTNPERNYLGQMFTLDFEDESVEQFGAARLVDLTQTQIVDAYACIMCNRCQENCPAYQTGKELSPAALEINKRYHIKKNGAALVSGEDELTLMEYAISRSAVWACTSCGACIDVCPVGNAPMLDIMDIRRDQVLMESSFPDELKAAFVGMERTGNPWQSTESRMEWAKQLEFPVPTVEENPDYEYLLWVGCAGAFNPDAQQIVRAVATVLNAAGVEFAVLGESEMCTGDSARRAGNEYLFYEMAMGNIETLNSAGADEKRIVTSCPHCLTTIGKEYGELGGNYEVYHHSQLIANLIGQGKLQISNGTLEKVTLHDPCYLGRHNGILAEPRDALARAGATLLEMDRSKTNSFCCGAGGAQMWKEEEHGSAAVNMTRFQEARSTGADTIAVACPFCATMMIDANTESGSPMQVKDIAQIVAEAI